MQRPSRDPQHLRRLNALLEQALALPVAERGPWLAGRGDDDRDFVPELARMLERAAAETDQFMRRPVAAVMDALDTAESLDQAGDLIGPWRLLQPLGEGGMATVWLAEHADGALARAVALKLPHPGWSAGLVQRMARERDLLAALAHPHIARLYDAGVSSNGRPWLAMEHVTGEPIDRYCQRHQLPPAAVLHLALQVCDALAHAHARLIVHRDLKPANILITEGGEVRLLDFGVGKLLQGDGQHSPAPPTLTQAMGAAMTPDYASPEQVAGQPATVATDVYSLGVVLYELLSGQRPYRLQRRSAAALEEAILAADVPLASRRCSDRARSRALRGDLDAVLAKALARPVAQRYATISLLADDLRAWLGEQPVLAQAPTRRYRLGKFVRRNRWPVAMVVAVALSLLSGLGLALWQAQAARLEAQRAHQARQFITSLLREAQPRQGQAAGGALSTADLLARAGERIDSELADDPRLAAELGILIGEQLDLLGEPQRGENVLREAVRRAQAQLGPRHPLSVHGRALLAGSLSVQKPDEALALAEALVPDALAGLPQTAGDAVEALSLLSFQRAKLDQVAPSIALLQRAAAVAEQHLGREHEQTLSTLGLLSNTHGRFRQFERQLAVADEAMQRAQGALGSARPHNTLSAVERWYGEALRRNSRPGDAVPILRRVVADQQTMDGADTPRVRNALYQLGLALAEAGAVGEALPLMRQVVAMEARHNPLFNEDRINLRNALVVVLGFARRGAEVEAVLDELQSLHREAQPASPAHGASAANLAQLTPDSARAVLASARMARVMAYRGRFAAAEAELDGRLDALARAQPPEPALRSDLWQALALTARLRGQTTLALQRAERGWADPALREARPDSRAALAAELAAARLARGDAAGALAINQQALALFSQAQVAPSPPSATAWITQARLELGAGRPAQALALLAPLVAAWAEANPGSDWHAEARHWQAVALAALGRHDAARAERQAAQPLLQASAVPALRALAMR
ncbi:serine/threonine-protein kinase [Aquabacterium sp. OR-4]|uniref:serine/threonine-protein kinase n=1 Tax=Aquabacterium sp. OR-4 TaxID=2978127 RepID=UPI0021B2A2B7|nr:serine/threonine-protein kinase [Aquabacterium sp. OR-4]MDT7837995.1 serine/threonine-protein kinase [Aquabacterium sp. OR-4]